MAQRPVTSIGDRRRTGFVTLVPFAAAAITVVVLLWQLLAMAEAEACGRLADVELIHCAAGPDTATLLVTAAAGVFVSAATALAVQHRGRAAPAE